MGRSGKILLAMIAIVFIVFNVVFFLIADTTNITSPITIVSWVFMLLGFVSFVLFSSLSSSKPGASNLVFMRFTLFGHCAIYLIIDFILAVFFTVLGTFVKIPLVWVISIQFIAFGIHVVIALACLLAKTTAENVGTTVKQKTSRMKSFRVDAEMLVEYCTDAAAKNDFRKFAEAVRYSDPMSNDALTEVEDQLGQIISEMKRHLMAGEIETAQEKCKTAHLILKDRNKKCLLFK